MSEQFINDGIQTLRGNTLPSSDNTTRESEWHFCRYCKVPSYFVSFFFTHLLSQTLSLSLFLYPIHSTLFYGCGLEVKVKVTFNQSHPLFIQQSTPPPLQKKKKNLSSNGSCFSPSGINLPKRFPPVLHLVSRYPPLPPFIPPPTSDICNS